MRTSQKHGLVKSLTAVLAVVLLAALMLAGCSDKTAQAAADAAKNAAAEAQAAADAANNAAAIADAKAAEAQNQANTNKTAIEELPDDAAVAEAIRALLNDYVKGTTLNEDSIITQEALEAFMTSDVVTTMLSKYALASSLAEYAKAADLTNLTTQLTAARTQIEAAILAQATTAATTYATKAELDNAKTLIATNLQTAISSASEQLTTIIADYYTKADMPAVLAAYGYSKAEVDELLVTSGIVAKYLEENDFATFGDLIQSLKDYADAAVKAHEDKWDAATEAVVNGVFEIEATIFEYENISNEYTLYDFTDIMLILEEAKIRLMRAQTVEDVEAILAAALDEAAAVYDIADRLAEAIDAVDVIVLPATAAANGFEYDSNEQITECETLLDLALNNLSIEEFDVRIKNYEGRTRSIRNLQEETIAARADYENLISADEDSDAVIAAFDALPTDYADIKVDQTAARENLLAKYKNVTEVELFEWKSLYFNNDEENLNISGIIGAANFIKLEAVASRIDALAALDLEAEDLDEDIIALLIDVKYLTLEDSEYVEGTVLYSALEALNAMKTTVDTWCETNGVTDETVLFPESYGFLENAINYAAEMTERYNAAYAEGGIIDRIDVIIEKAISLDIKDEYKGIVEDIIEWRSGAEEDDIYVDENNLIAIMGQARYDAMDAIFDRINQLDEAINDNELLDEINNSISALSGNVKVNSMTEIRRIRNLIVSWLNTNNIVPAEVDETTTSAIATWIRNANSNAHDTVLDVTGPVVEANYSVIKLADLDTIISECNVLLGAAIADANVEGGVRDLMNAIDDEDDFILYQYDNIEAARKSYDAWAKKHGIEVVNLETLDFGESDISGSGVLKASFLKYSAAAAELKTALDAAKADYAEALEIINTVIAMKSETEITVKVTDAVVIDAYNAVKTWCETYTDERGFTGFENIDDILTKTENDTVNEVYEAYLELVAAAKADADAIKVKADALKVDVYSEDKIDAVIEELAAWEEEYSINDEDYDAELGELDESLKFMKAVKDGLDDKAEAYDLLIIELKAMIVNEVGFKALIDALENEDFTIYSGETVAAARTAYNVWAVKAGLTDMTAAAFVAPAAEGEAETDDIDDAEILAIKTTIEKLIADEAVMADIETAKENETVAVEDLIAVLLDEEGGLKAMTSASGALIKAARDAYAAWLAGDNFTGNVKDAASYAINLENAKYAVDNYAKLEEAEEDFAEIKAKLDDANAKLDAIPTGMPADATEAAALSDAILAAETAVDAFYTIDGNTNNGGLVMDQLGKLAKAKMALALYNKLLDVSEDNTALIAELNTAYVNKCTAIDEMEDSEIVATKGERVNTLVNLFYDEMTEIVNSYAPVAPVTP